MGSGNYPWGPHGPQSSPYEVRPNPTAASPAPAFEQPDSGASMPMAGGGGGGGLGAILADFVISVVFFFIVWEAAACLYFITAIVGIGASIFSFSILNPMITPMAGRDAALLASIVIGWVAAAFMSRLEFRLAKNQGFRIGRHIVRLMLLSILAIPIMMLSMGVPAPSTTTRFILAIVSSPQAMVRFLSTPATLVIWLGVIVGIHFAVWKWEWARRFWHRRLRMVGLK
jgi:hypothetical protein